MPVGGPRLVPIFGGPARNFRCIIYGRFNEPRKRSKGPRGLFLIIRRRQRGDPDGLSLLALRSFSCISSSSCSFSSSSSSSSLASLSLQSPDTPSFVTFDNALSPDASKVILITRNIIEARWGASEKTWFERWNCWLYDRQKYISSSFDYSFLSRAYQRANSYNIAT